MKDHHIFTDNFTLIVVIQNFDEATILVQHSMDVNIVFTKKHEIEFSAMLKQTIRSPLRSSTM